MFNFLIPGELTKKRWKQFRQTRRAYYSLLILGSAFLLSLFAELWIGDKPLLMGYKGNLYMPLLKFYPQSEFGQAYATQTDYQELARDSSFKTQGGWMLWPLIPQGPLQPHLNLPGNPPHPPSTEHWLGTDASARDVLARLVYGFRLCMLFSLLLTFISSLLGILIGGVQGYLGGWPDVILQRCIEIGVSLPMLYIVILLSSIYGRGFWLLLLVSALFSWVGLSYYMRSEFFRLRSQTWVKAAKVLRLGPTRIFFKHVLPNGLTPVITFLPFALIGGISSLTALDFLGFGLQPPTPSWGELMKQALDNLYAPWLALSAVGALFVTLLLATFIGEGIREAFDSRLDQGSS